MLGVLTTIAVAWALVANYGVRSISSTGVRLPADSGRGGILIYRFHWFGSVEISITAGAIQDQTSPGDAGPGEIGDVVPWWARSAVPARGQWDGDAGYTHRLVEAHGWPFPALWSSFEAQPNPTGYWPYEPLNGLVVSRTWEGPKPHHLGAMPFVLPLRPAGLGFVIDAAIYVSLWLILLLVPGAVRRARRRAHGWCMACGYDLQAAPAGAPCPECGRDRIDRPTEGVV
jgi:hypothetical protein